MPASDNFRYWHRFRGEADLSVPLGMRLLSQSVTERAIGLVFGGPLAHGTGCMTGSRLRAQPMRGCVLEGRSRSFEVSKAQFSWNSKTRSYVSFE